MDDHPREPHDPADAGGSGPHPTPPSGPGAPDPDATGPMDLDELLEDEPQRLASRPVSGAPSMEDETVADGPLIADVVPGAAAAETVAVDGDETVAARGDETVVRPVDADATQIVPPLDPEATAIVPPLPPRDLDQTLVNPPVDDQWRAQATVRPADRSQRDEPSGEFQSVDQGRGWLLPVLLGVAGLVFIIGIAYALVVATRGNNSPPAPSPAPTPSPPAASTAPPTSPSPSISEPSVSPSSPSVPAVHVELPNLTGSTLAVAEATLVGLGLPYVAVPEVDDTHAENTVTRMSPAAGLVDPTTTVTLTYAVPSGSASPSAPEPSASSS